MSPEFRDMLTRFYRYPIETPDSIACLENPKGSYLMEYPYTRLGGKKRGQSHGELL